MRSFPESQPSISLRDVLPEAEFHGWQPVPITRAQADSAACRPGDLFVPLAKGAKAIRRQAEQAATRGAAVVLLEHPLDVGMPFCLVRDVREAYGQICHALARRPSEKLRVIAVAGNSGRTPTAMLTARALETAGLTTGLLCHGGSLPGRVEESAFDRAGAPEIAGVLDRMLALGHTHAVAEITPRALRSGTWAGAEFDLVCLCGSKKATGGDPSENQLQQTRLLESLRPEGVTVVNADAPGSASLIDVCHGPTLSVGLDSPAEISATVLEETLAEQTFLLHTGQISAPIRTRLIGRRHAYHLLLAAANSLAYGLEPEAVIRGLEGVERIPLRLERIECGQSFSVFVDQANTPQSLRVALKELRRLCRGRLIVVLGPTNRRASLNPWLGRTAEAHADRVIVTTRAESGREGLLESQTLWKSLRRSSCALWQPDRRTAIAQALSSAAPGDCVLIAGQEEHPWSAEPTTVELWDDREITSRLLYTEEYRRLPRRSVA